MFRKGLVLVLTCMIVAAMMTGCGSGSNQAQQSQQPSNSSQQTQEQQQSSGAAGQNGSTQQGNSSEKPVAPEKNPPGDIPDSQVFVEYVSTLGHYALQVPEGWARTENGADVQFVDKLDGIEVKVTDSSETLTVDNVKNNQVAALEQAGRAVQVKSVEQVNLHGGQAILVKYDSNSEPDPVTNKQVRQENESIFFANNGKLVQLVLWAPLGADNVDQWNLIENSFQWR